MRSFYSTGVLVRISYGLRSCYHSNRSVDAVNSDVVVMNDTFKIKTKNNFVGQTLEFRLIFITLNEILFST